MASSSLVKYFGGAKRSTTYPDMPWEPKESFRAVVDSYANHYWMMTSNAAWSRTFRRIPRVAISVNCWLLLFFSNLQHLRLLELSIGTSDFACLSFDVALILPTLYP